MDNPATEMRLELEAAAKELMYAYERIREVHRKTIKIEKRIHSDNMKGGKKE